MNPVMSMSPALAAAATRAVKPEPLLRALIGDALRSERLDQHRTLRNVSQAARVSLGYLSEIERGQKEASSELLAAICTALEIRVADILLRVLSAVQPRPVVARPAGVETLPVRPSDRVAPPVVNRAA